MKSTLPLLLFVFLFVSGSCQKYSVDNLPELQLHFGEGGGFTGAVTEYCLLKNGQLFEKTAFTEDFKPSKKIKKKLAKKSFKTCKKMEIDKIELNNPGDRYYFITYQTEKINHRITWGRNKEEVSPDILKLYAKLKAFTTKD